MKTQIKKWGNSASIRIPSAIMAAAHLSLNQTVEVREEAGRIVIEPITTPVYKLEDLLVQMKRKTFHNDWDDVAEELAARKHISITEAIKYALKNELRRTDNAIPLMERLKPLLQKIKSYPNTGLIADKAFFDELSGEY